MKALVTDIPFLLLPSFLADQCSRFCQVCRYSAISAGGEQQAPHGTVVQVRFDPFNLDELFLYDDANRYLETTSPTKKLTDIAPNIPEESRNSPRKISQESVSMFTRLREHHRRQLTDAARIPFSKLFEHHAQEDNDE